MTNDRILQRLLVASCMLVVVTSGAIVCAVGQEPSQQQSAMPADRLPKDWLLVLNAFVAHDDAAQRVVEDSARHSEDPHTRELAAMLQNEWDFRSNAEALARPRQVFMPKVPPDAGKGQTDTAVQSETFVFDITISREGAVTSAEFRKPPTQKELGEMARARVLQALYRPVFDGREFISFSAVVTSTIEVKQGVSVSH